MPEFLDAAGARLERFAKENRLALNQIDGTRPDAIYQLFQQHGLLRKVDALFSIDSLVHVDLQYITTYLVNAALVLKPDGRIVMNVGDATSEAGFRKLIGDIARFYKYQGRACARFEYQSGDILKSVLERLGFEIEHLENWSPRQWEPCCDLYVTARLAHPERADMFRHAITTGLIQMLATGDRPDTQGDEDVTGSVTEERRNIARALGLAYWRRLLVQSNPDITKEQMQEQMKESWGGSRREYTRLGMAVLKQLENMGYTIKQTDEIRTRKREQAEQ